MKPFDRREFFGQVGALLVTSAACGETQTMQGLAQQGQTEPRHQELAAALRALNQAAGIGIAPEELARAERYATGAYRDVQARLRPIVLPDDLDLPVRFSARRKP